VYRVNPNILYHGIQNDRCCISLTMQCIFSNCRDHSAGNAGMKKRYEGIKVYGGYGDNVPDATK